MTTIDTVAQRTEKFKISTDLSIVWVSRPLTYGKASPPRPCVHHVIVLDCSGSMWDSHPKMRKQLSEKLFTLVSEGDSVSVVWFSGRGESGVAIELAQLPTLREVAAMQKLFERWIKPIGLTGFKEPLADVRALLGRTSKRGEAVSLFFLSDGCDNQWPREEIMKEIDLLAPMLMAATIVEYGYYADRALLAKMAERFGGAHVFAEDFVKFEPTLQSALLGHVDVGPRADAAVGGALGGVAYHLGEDHLHVYDAAGGMISVAEAVLEGGGVWYLTKDATSALPFITPGTSAIYTSALYAALAVFSTRMMPEVIYPILRQLSDVRFVRRYGSLFGKQAYTEFMVEAEAAAYDTTLRGIEGIDPLAVPADDAFTVLDLLEMLSSNPDCKLLLDDPRFRYSRISRKRLDATEGEKLKFVGDAQPGGYQVSNLTWNEDRANVSVLVKREGVVDLGGRLPFAGKVPQSFPTFVYRNYAIVADGMRNVDTLIIRAPRAVLDELYANGVDLNATDSLESGARAEIKLEGMPVLNRAKVARISAKSLFTKCAELEEKRARLKVFKTYLAEEKRSETWDERYGKEGASWLKEQGLTAWSGFQPPRTKQVEASDYYLGKVLEVKIKGWSSLPSVKDVTSGKSKNAPAQYMALAISEAEGAKASLGPTFQKWVVGAVNMLTAETRALLREIAKEKFAVIVSGTWFSEFKSLEERAVLGLTVGGKPTEVEAVMSEEKVLL